MFCSTDESLKNLIGYTDILFFRFKKNKQSLLLKDSGWRTTRTVLFYGQKVKLHLKQAEKTNKQTKNTVGVYDYNPALQNLLFTTKIKSGRKYIKMSTAIDGT